MTPVQQLYHLGHAQWYDPFRKIWTFFVEKQVEREFLKILDTSITPNTNILELGCGTGINVQRLLSLNKQFASYTGIDFSFDMLAVAQKKFSNNKKVSLVQHDLITYSFPQKYDLVICTWVLSHIKNPCAQVNRVYDGLLPGGKMLLIFLTKPKWYLSFWFTQFAQLFHSTYVSSSEIQQFNGEKEIKQYASGLATFVVITKPRLHPKNGGGSQRSKSVIL